MTPIDRRNLLRAGGAATLLASLTGVTPGADPQTQGNGSRKRIKIGQIGVGHGHASKLSIYRASADYEVVGIVEPDAELRRRAAAQGAYRDLPWMSQEQLLNVPGLEAVLIETRVRDSLAAAESCIQANMHIHLDKPAGVSFPQFRRILQAAESRKRLVQMGYMYRYSPAVILLREMLKQGWLGEPFEIETVMSKVVPPADRTSLAEYPGGMMFELGCHLIDLVVGLLGRPSAVTPFPAHSGPVADGLADNMLAVLRYPRTLVSVKSSALEIEGGARRHFVVCGSEGTFHIQPLDSPAVRLALSRPRGSYRKGYQDITLPRFERYVADAADMARIIREEKASDYPYSHDLDVQETVLRASNQPTEA